jgi:hypothetical protein
MGKRGSPTGTGTGARTGRSASSECGTGPASFVLSRGPATFPRAAPELPRCTAAFASCTPARRRDAVPPVELASRHCLGAAGLKQRPRLRLRVAMFARCRCRSSDGRCGWRRFRSRSGARRRGHQAQKAKTRWPPSHRCELRQPALVTLQNTTRFHVKQLHECPAGTYPEAILPAPNSSSWQAIHSAIHRTISLQSHQSPVHYPQVHRTRNRSDLPTDSLRFSRASRPPTICARDLLALRR